MRYFAGNSLAAFFRTSTASVEITTAGSFDSTYVSNAIRVAQTTSSEYIESWPFNATGTVWFRFDVYNSVNTANTNFGATLMNGTTPVFRLSMPANAIVRPQYWNGSAWVNTGVDIAVSMTGRPTFVVKVELGVGFECWMNGTSVSSGSGWAGTLETTVTAFRGYSFGTGGVGTHYSQIMVADYDLRDSHIMSAALNGNSLTNTAGTGAYGDLNETALDESTAVILASAGKKGQTKATITVPAGQGISAMVINARGRVSGGVVTDGKLGIRSGGANYSSSGRGYNGGFEPRGYIAESNPDGSVAWNETTFNAAEIYEEAA